MSLARAIVLLGLIAPATAFAERETSRDSLERLEETLSGRLEQGLLDTKTLLPAIVVSVAPAYEESKAWYSTAALASLVHVFGSSGLRMCEACMAPRTFVGEAQVESSSGAISTADIVRLDDGVRGEALPARTAIWLDEAESGVSLRIVDLGTSRIVVAENFDPAMHENVRTAQAYNRTKELERRARGDSLTQTFIDVGLYPNQHIAFEWTEQWGDTNNNISGITLTIVDPFLGLGGGYYRVIPEAWNLMVGGQLDVSLLTALVRGVSGQNVDIIDPLLTAVFVMRMPFGGSNYGLLFTASTAGRITLGLSMMNLTFIPVLP